MNKKFSKHWKSSKQPRKQRKYRTEAPLHLKRKFLSINLSKELRKSYGKRNTEVKKGDIVKILVGKFKKQKGKILEVYTKIGKVAVEGIQVKKRDGSKVNLKLQPSNLQIIELADRDNNLSKSQIKENKSNKDELKKNKSIKKTNEEKEK